MILAGKVAWITGASRGIGQAIALAYAREGAQTVLVATERARLDATVDMLRSASCIEPVVAEYDITNARAVGAAFGQVHKQLGRLDILVNNAGIMRDALLGMITDDQVRRTFEVNVHAAIFHLQYAARLMARAGGGSVINMSSLVGRVGHSGQTVYAASKAALIGATLSAAKELAPQRIRVNAIAPGIIESDLLKDLPPARREEKIGAVGMGRIGTPADVARAALYLASDQSDYVTGQVLGVDGGLIL